MVIRDQKASNENSKYIEKKAGRSMSAVENHALRMTTYIRTQVRLTALGIFWYSSEHTWYSPLETGNNLSGIFNLSTIVSGRRIVGCHG